MIRPLILGALGLLAACAEPAPTTARFEDQGALLATVETVDMVNRQVLLRGDSGRVVSVTPGPEVRNLGQLRSGDRVRVAFSESATARMASATDADETVVAAVGERAAEGERPGGAVGRALVSVVEWMGYNPATAVATFQGPSGLVHSVVVPESMRAFAAARQPGERVAIEYSEAIAIDIQPVAG